MLDNVYLKTTNCIYSHPNFCKNAAKLLMITSIVVFILASLNQFGPFYGTKAIVAMSCSTLLLAASILVFIVVKHLIAKERELIEGEERFAKELAKRLKNERKESDLNDVPPIIAQGVVAVTEESGDVASQDNDPVDQPEMGDLIRAQNNLERGAFIHNFYREHFQRYLMSIGPLVEQQLRQSGLDHYSDLATSSTKIGNLVADYVGKIDEGIDPLHNLRNFYQQCHAGNPSKLKELKILPLDISNQSTAEFFLLALFMWIERCKALSEEPTIGSLKLRCEDTAALLIRFVEEWEQINNRILIWNWTLSVALSAENEIVGFSFGGRFPGEKVWTLDVLVSSPDNYVRNEEGISGVGTALLEGSLLLGLTQDYSFGQSIVKLRPTRTSVGFYMRNGLAFSNNHFFLNDPASFLPQNGGRATFV